MPGYIMHLAVARLVVDKLGFSDFNDKFKVYVGSVMADTMERSKKKESHFWSDESIKLLKRMPEVDVFREKYRKNMDDPMVMAYMLHLYMDRRFVDDYWTRHFEFFNDDMESESGYDKVTWVRIKDTGQLLPRSEFLSDRYYYGDYTRLLPYITYKYNLKDIFEGRKPDEISSMLDKLDCSVIEEIKGNDYKNQIMDMFESVYNVEKTQYPELKVFNLAELESLVSDTSDMA